MAEKISSDLIDTGSIAQMLGVTRIHATSSINHCGHACTSRA